MPVLTGIKLEDARARLRQAGLPEPRLAYMVGAEGVVLRQIPVAGTRLSDPKRAPQLFVGRAARPPAPSALATPAPPPRVAHRGTNWLVLAITAACLFLAVSSLAARWGLSSKEGEVRITRRGRKKPSKP